MVKINYEVSFRRNYGQSFINIAHSMNSYSCFLFCPFQPWLGVAQVARDRVQMFQIQKVS